jgi:hypothetical protein
LTGALHALAKEWDRIQHDGGTEPGLDLIGLVVGKHMKNAGYYSFPCDKNAVIEVRWEFLPGIVACTRMDLH